MKMHIRVRFNDFVITCATRLLSPPQLLYTHMQADIGLLSSLTVQETDVGPLADPGGRGALADPSRCGP